MNAPKVTHERQAAAYTHSPWSGKRYAKRQTVASLTAESMAVLRNHPRIGKKLLGAKVTP